MEPHLLSTPCRHCAAESGHADCLARLLAVAPSSATAANDQAMTPCHFAAQNGHADAIDVLVHASPAAATITTVRSFTPLHIAAIKGHTTAVKRLLAAVPATAAARTESGATPLYLAAQNGYEGAVAALLEAAPGTALIRASVSPAGREWTPAHIAAIYGHVGVLKLILKTAPEAAWAHDKVVSLSLPEECSQCAGVVYTLERHLARPVQLPVVLHHSSLSIVAALQGNTPLDLALMRGNYKAARVLRAHGAAVK